MIWCESGVCGNEEVEQGVGESCRKSEGEGKVRKGPDERKREWNGAKNKRYSVNERRQKNRMKEQNEMG